MFYNYLLITIVLIYLSGCKIKTIKPDATLADVDLENTTAIHHPQIKIDSIADTAVIDPSITPHSAANGDANNDLIKEQTNRNSSSESLTTTTATIIRAPKKLQQSDNLWERLQEGYRLDWQSNALIHSMILHHTRHPNSVMRVTQQAKPYLYHIINEIEKRGIPTEIALLPIVESRYDPFAYSPGRASGIWQFIPRTGRQFGLEQNWWYDGRRDITASTEAALDYLTYLNKIFRGDWLLSLAAYNAGEGTVLKAMRRNRQKGKPTDYWSLSLPKETTYYVPKLLAWSEIIKNPTRYQLNLHHIPNKPYFTTVDIGSQIDLAEAAAMANIDIDHLYQLNPGYNRWATDPKPPHYMVVPTSQAATLIEALATRPIDQRITWQRYTINDGDSLISIAKKFGITVDLLKTTNQIKTHHIRSGKHLIIPSASMPSAYYSMSVDQRLVQRQDRAAEENKEQTIYYVKSGDNLWSIAKRYNVGINSLAKWNGMIPRDTLKPGQKLLIWSNTPTKHIRQKKSDVTRHITYSVRSGDSLSHIAHKFSLRIKDILQWNGIESDRYLQPGQQLSLYLDVTNLYR